MCSSWQKYSEPCVPRESNYCTALMFYAHINLQEQQVCTFSNSLYMCDTFPSQEIEFNYLYEIINEH